MAIPPEPIEDLIGEAIAGVVAEVVRVVKTSSRPAAGEAGFWDTDVQQPAQLVELKVTRVLFGSVETGAVLQAEKPLAPYLLARGHKGPMLLGARAGGTGPHSILGRYGPDSYREEDITSAAGQRPVMD